jgi:UbiD family decarboxylase
MKEQPDLHTYLNDLKKNHPRHMITFPNEVSRDFISTAVALELENLGLYPTLWFEKIQGFNQSLVANLFASNDLLAYSIGVQPGEFNEVLGNCLDKLIPAKVVSNGPVHDVVWIGEEVDLYKLPIPQHFRDDAGQYITAGMVAARDPENGVGNLAYARLQIKDKRRMGVSLHSRQHLWDYQRRAALAGKDLPVAVIIGAHPAVMIAAAAKMGMQDDEYDLAGALLKQPLTLCKGLTVDVNVPSNAEIVIEGVIKANEQETEGPFGEYTGYMTGRSTNNVMEVTAITLRHDAIFVDIIPGNSSEHLTLGRASKEAWIFKRMQEALPFFRQFYYPSSGTHFHCYIQIEKTSDGQAKQAAQLLIGLDHYVKLAIVVDKDIDPTNESMVMWAVATRMQADRDASIISGLMCNQLDPSSQGGIGAKMILDATRPIDATARRVELPAESVIEAAKLLSSVGFNR